jgi:antitoxin MazE
MRAVVKKWGNSAAVRIPSGIMESAQLKLDEPVDVREEGGRIIVEPIRRGKFDLAELLAGITAQNVHSAIDFGAGRGKELL